MNSDPIMDSTPIIKETLSACDKAIRELTAQRDSLLLVLSAIIPAYDNARARNQGNQLLASARAVIAGIEASDSIPDETDLKLAQYREDDRQAKIAAETHRQRVGPLDFPGRDD